MLDQDSVRNLVLQMSAGDATAAQQLWERYYRRLVGLARVKLADSSKSAEDEEDVALSALRTFFRRAQAGKFADDDLDRTNLWPLLAIITARKAANQRTRQRRLKRGGGRVKPEISSDADSGFARVMADEPSPEELASFFAALEQFMDSLEDPIDRIVLLWKLEERTNVEIAEHLDCSLSGVERRMRAIRERLVREILS